MALDLLIVLWFIYFWMLLIGYFVIYGLWWKQQRNGYTGLKFCLNDLINDHKFRGASVSEEEKIRLNKLVGNILREAGVDFEEDEDYDSIRKKGYAGYAHLYLQGCRNVSKKINEADASIYRQLIDIDSKLGTEASEQLFWCLQYTTRWDIIKVLLFASNETF